MRSCLKTNALSCFLELLGIQAGQTIYDLALGKESSYGSPQPLPHHRDGGLGGEHYLWRDTWQGRCCDCHTRVVLLSLGIEYVVGRHSCSLANSRQGTCLARPGKFSQKRPWRDTTMAVNVRIFQELAQQAICNCRRLVGDGWRLEET